MTYEGAEAAAQKAERQQACNITVLLLDVRLSGVCFR